MAKMNIIEATKQLRDDLKLWVANNLREKADKDYVDEKIAEIPEVDLFYATPQMYGAVGDGATDDTAALNECLANNSFVYIPSGTYLIDATICVQPKSNQTIQLDPNATLKGTANVSGYGDWPTVKCTGVENVTIRGGSIVGDRAEYPDDTTMEFMAGIVVKLSKNIVIDSCRIHGFRGDGIAACTEGYADEYEEKCNRNIKVVNCEIYECNRHGMFVDGIDGFVLENTIIHDCNTSDFSCAIDFEVHYERNKIHNITIKNVTSYNTSLGIHCSEMIAGAYENFKLNNCVIDRFAHNFDADVEIRNSRIGVLNQNGYGELRVYDSYINRMSFSETGNNSGKAYFYKCHFDNNDNLANRIKAILQFGYLNGEESDVEATFEGCAFVSYKFADGESRTIQNALIYASTLPKAINFNNCNFYINNPNGFGSALNGCMNSCNINVNFDYDGSADVLLSVTGNSVLSNNVFDITGAKWTTENTFLISAHGNAQKIVLTENVVLKGIGDRYVFPIYDRIAGSTLICINNVFKDYWLESVLNGIDMDNVTFVNVGMITADSKDTSVMINEAIANLPTYEGTYREIYTGETEEV